MQKKPNILRTAATVPFGLLIAACSGSGDVVDLGGGSAELEAAPAACAGPEGDGYVTVNDQAGLEALRGCEELGGLSIMDFFGAGLDLRPLSSLRVIRGGLSIAGSLFDRTAEPGVPDTTINSLEGLESLQRVGSLSLNEFSAPTLEPLGNLTEVSGGSIAIHHASRLRNLAGLDNAGGVWSLGLSYAPELETLDGLRLPSQAGNITLMHTPKLTDIEALGPVDGVDTLYIHGTGIQRLDATLQVNLLDVRNNPALVDITGLDTLVSASIIHIENNPRLSRLPNLEQLMLLDWLVVVGNPELRWLPTLPSLEGGSPTQEDDPEDLPMRTLKIASNASLQQFVAPARLRGVTYLSIQDNANLSEIDLGGLEALTELTIANNPSLVSVSLDKLETVNSLEVLDNGQLPTAGFSEVQTFTSNIQGNAGEPAP
jgi:hypothetical protein